MPATKAGTPAQTCTPDAASDIRIPIGWKGPLAPLDKLSGDRRVLASPPDGQPRVRPLPLPMGYQDTLAAGHDGAYVVSSIDDAWIEDGLLKGRGRFDLADERAVEAARKLAAGYIWGVSGIDLDDTTTTLAVATPAADGDGDTYAITPIDGETFDQTQLADGDKLVEVATDWRLMGATFVSQPAFAEAVIEPVYDEAEFEDDLDDDEVALLDAMIADGSLDTVVHADTETASSNRAAAKTAAVESGCGCTPLLAAGAPEAPPTAWFDDPQLGEPSPITVDAAGRVAGHLALWGTCHTGFPGSCVAPPRNHTGYAYFHVGAIRTAEGDELPVGTIVLGTDHASLAANHHAAMAHYADTGHAVAAVRVGEDDHGIWVSGALLPDAGNDKVAALRRSPLSGDWRVIGGRQELVAALAVNTPGFPIPRSRTGADGRPWSLVAAGALAIPHPRSAEPMPMLAASAETVQQLAHGVAVELDRLAQDRAAAGTSRSTDVRSEPADQLDDPPANQPSPDVRGRIQLARRRVARARMRRSFSHASK